MLSIYPERCSIQQTHVSNKQAKCPQCGLQWCILFRLDFVWSFLSVKRNQTTGTSCTFSNSSTDSDHLNKFLNFICETPLRSDSKSSMNWKTYDIGQQKVVNSKCNKTGTGLWMSVQVCWWVNPLLSYEYKYLIVWLLLQHYQHIKNLTDINTDKVAKKCVNSWFIHGPLILCNFICRWSSMKFGLFAVIISHHFRNSHLNM